MKIKVKVKPNSGKQDVKQLEDKSYIVNVKSAPENNKANLETMKLLQRFFKKPVKIVSGFNGRNKIIEVENEI